MPRLADLSRCGSDSLRALAVCSPEWLAAFPSLPTLTEQGFPALVQSIWLSLSGPCRLIEPVVARMKAAIPAGPQNAAVNARTVELVTLRRNPPPLGANFVPIMRADIATAREVARR